MKFVFIAKHRTIWAGGMAMRSNGRVPVGLPCLAEPIAQRQIPKRRSGQPAGEGKLPCQRPDLRRTACLERPIGRRRRMRSAPDRAADALAGLAGTSTAPAPSEGRGRSPGYGRASEPSGPAVCRRAAEPEVDRRLYLHLDGRGLALSGGRHRPVLAPGGRLVDERQHDSAIGCGCPVDGHLAARQAGCPDASLGSGQPICQRTVPALDGRQRHRLQYEPVWQCLGQCGDGELFLVVEDRAHRAQNLSQQERGQSRCVRLHRAVLQRDPPSLDDRIPQPC